MKKCAVIGLGRFGYALACSLEEYGATVIAIDSNMSLVDKIKNDVSYSVMLDSTDKNALLSQEIDKVDIVIVAIGEHFEANQLTTLNCKELGIPTVISRAMTDTQSKILSLIGASRVISLEKSMGERLAHQLIYNSFDQYIELSDNISVAELNVPSKFVSKSIKEIGIRHNYGLNIILIKQKIESLNADGQKDFTTNIINVPYADYVFLEDDIIVVSGEKENVNKLAEFND